VPNLNPQEVKDWRLEVNYDTTRAALYYPWIEVMDMANGGGKTRLAVSLSICSCRSWKKRWRRPELRSVASPKHPGLDSMR